MSNSRAMRALVADFPRQLNGRESCRRWDLWLPKPLHSRDSDLGLNTVISPRGHDRVVPRFSLRGVREFDASCCARIDVSPLRPAQCRPRYGRFPHQRDLDIALLWFESASRCECNLRSGRAATPPWQLPKPRRVRASPCPGMLMPHHPLRVDDERVQAAEDATLRQEAGRIWLKFGSPPQEFHAPPEDRKGQPPISIHMAVHHVFR